MSSVEVEVASSGDVNHRSCLEFVDAEVHLNFKNYATWSGVCAAGGVSIGDNKSNDQEAPSAFASFGVYFNDLWGVVSNIKVGTDTT